MASICKNRITKTAAAAIAFGAVASLAIAAPANAADNETPDGFYSSKQPYVAPTDADIAAYSQAPDGYEPLATESVARHGSRGLSSFKYDALLHLLAKTAQAENGFLTPEIGEEFIANLDGITAANVENGYGMLTGQGELQHEAIGKRALECNKALFDDADNRIVAQTSGEPRATESGESFLEGFGAEKTELEPGPELLYSHKVENPDGTDKAEGSPERKSAEAYDEYIEKQTDDGGTIVAAMDYIEDLPRSVEVADELLSGIFTPEFIASIGTDEAHTWFLTEDGTEDGEIVCAPGADPAADPDACGEPEKSIESPVDAAMTLYNLYIIAVDMAEENVAPHEFEFAQYFEGREADAEWFAYLLDAEDFYEKGPGLADHTETFEVAQPLLDDFFAAIDQRAEGGDVAATFRFGHAETIVPFAALLRLPGSTVAAPDNASPSSADDVYDYENNPWRGAEVTPMAANVQWDVVSRDGVDPATGADYAPLVRMLYNEREIAFAEGCQPVAEGSNWVKVTELKRCLNGEKSDESPLIGDASGALAETGGVPVAALWIGGGVLVVAVAVVLVIAKRRRAAQG